MQIGSSYSHFNAREWLLVHEKGTWKEIQDIIESIDGNMLASYIEVHSALREQFKEKGWKISIQECWAIEEDEFASRAVLKQSAERQDMIAKVKSSSMRTHHFTQYKKNRIAIGIQIADESYFPYDMRLKYLEQYRSNAIDVGIEIYPTKKMQSQMYSGSGYFERVLHHIARQGRGAPAVPLLLIGVEP